MLPTRRSFTVAVSLIVVATGTTWLAPASSAAWSAPTSYSGTTVPESRTAPAGQAARIADQAGITLAAAQRVLASEAAEVQPDDSVVFIDDWGDSEHEVPAVHSSRSSGGTGDVLALHSDPTASQTLYLDFDGATLVGTDWNTGIRRLPEGPYSGFSIDADSAFSLVERQLVKEAWRETSAYFAAFDIDVTTEEPPRPRIERAGESDQEFGSWIIISTDAELKRGTCGICGGVAQLGVYGAADGRQWQRPAFSFMASASTIAHEVGHHLGLLHDGVRHADGRVDEYYSGHGLWEPIMGAGGPRESISQWSPGDYHGATNTEDDYTVMAAHGLVWRPDHGGATPSTAAPVSTSGVTTGTLGRDDIDVIAVPACPGTLTAVAEVPDGGGLDVSLDLLDANGDVVAGSAVGVQVAADDQLSRQREGQTEVVQDATGRARYARVTPGFVPGPQGYPAYGSVGRYEVASACDMAAPAAPSQVQVSTSFRQVTVSWEAPPAGVVTGYRVHLGARSQVVPAGVRTFAAFTDPEARGIDVGVEALSGTAAGPRVTAAVSLPPMPTVTLNAPVVDREAGTASVTWTGTISPDITDAQWRVTDQDTGGRETLLPLSSRSHTLGRLPASGSLGIELCLRIPLRENASYVVCDSQVATYPALAPAPADLRATVADWKGTVDVSWSPVPDAIRYELSVDRSPWRTVTSPARLTSLDLGEHEVRLRAITSSGPGGAAVTYPYVMRAPSAPRDAVATPSADGTRIDLTWQPPSDTQGLTRYVLAIPAQGLELSLPADAGAYTLTGQVPGTKVDLVLAGAGEQVWGEFVNVQVQMPGPSTGGSLPVPRIDGVRPGRPGGRATVLVRWSGRTAEVTVSGWELSFTTVDVGRSITRTTTTSPGRRHLDWRLPKSRTWRAKVRALGVDGEVGAWSKASRAVSAR